MNKPHVSVLMGGPSAEREISLRTGENATRALRAAGLRVSPVDVRGADFEMPSGTDVVFLALHGTFGEDGQIQRLLEMRGLPYTGSDAAASERAFDKAKAKKAFLAAGVPTPRCIVLERDLRPLSAVRLPVIVKPARQGSSYGVTMVEESGKLEDAVVQAWHYDQKLLIEEFVQGREFTVGVFEGRALPVVEIRTHRKIFDYRAKYLGESDEIVPAPVDAATTQRLQRIALQAHECLGCRDYSRVDMILGGDGQIYVLEVNTLPGLTEQSLLPKAAAADGISLERLCVRLVELAMDRCAEAVAA